MSEINLIGGDTWYTLDQNQKLCQTFSPTFDFNLLYLDICAKNWNMAWPPQAFIFYADDHHRPYGDILATSAWLPQPHEHTDEEHRIRLHMGKWMLFKDGYYAIVLWITRKLPPVSCKVLYIAAGNKYLRGLMSTSDDYGLTWTPHYDSDLIFAAFGDPPSPPTPKPAPISRWFLIYHKARSKPYGYDIEIWTQTPVHLWLQWTEHPPWTHKQWRTTRGEQVELAVHYCFTAYNVIEQEEAGDTLYHTFIWKKWVVCIPRWYRFRGTIEDLQGPSDTPVFFLHRVTPIVKLLFEEPWSYWTKAPPYMELIFEEPWTFGVPSMTLLFEEPWTFYSPRPPDMHLLFEEPWTYLAAGPPAMILLFEEPWTHIELPPPAMILKFIEEWST